MRTKKREIALVGVLGVAVVGSTLAVVQRQSDYTFFDPLIDVKTMVDRLYVEPVDNDALQSGAIVGMLEALGDQHTVYIPPADASEFNKAITGEYVGIGSEVVIRDGWLTIVNPMDDSPSLAAGLRPDDQVRAIDGTSTEGLSVDACIEILQGVPKTPVVLTIVRGSETLEITVIRDQIKTRDVQGFSRDLGTDGRWRFLIDAEAAIAYVKIARFTDQVTEQVRQALTEAEREAGKALGGVVLDMRDDPGGRLDEAIRLADLFIEGGTIVSTRGRTQPESVAKAKAGDAFEDVPVVVLINGQSASASEIVAGALADNERAIIVGTRSLGKGSVQTVRPVPSKPGAFVKITEQLYYLPSGRCLHRTADATVWGVDPTPGYYVPLDDRQNFERRIARREREIIRLDAGAAAADEAWSAPAWIAEALKDPQLSLALEAVQHRAREGQWPEVDPSRVNPDAVLAGEIAALELRRGRIERELDRVLRQLEAMQSGAGEVEVATRDLWSDDIDLVGGTVVVRDAEGNEIQTLRITNPGLELWLLDAGVEVEVVE